MKVMTRKEAVEDAMANAELEGYTFTQKQKEVFEKLAKEELSFEDVYKIINREIEYLKKTRPEVFIQ